MKYDFKTVEAKWQKVWADEKTFHAEIDHSKPKFYALVEFSVEEALVRGSPHLHTEHLISRLLYSLNMQASLAGNTALPQPGLVSATRLLVHSLHGSYLAEEQEL